MKQTSAVFNLLTDLKACSIRRDLQWGRRIHAKSVESQNDSNMYVSTTLIKMYAKCGAMADARQVFDSIQSPNVVSWTALVLGYAENGEGNAALDLFSRMKADGCAPNGVTYVAAIKACTSIAANGDDTRKEQCLELGRQIHSEVGRHLDQYVQNTLVDMYAKCGSMVEARRVFNSIDIPNVVSWTVLILGYAENGDGHAALDMFSAMKASGCAPNPVTYVAALKACTALACNADGGGKGDCLERGKLLHSEIGLQMDHCVQSTLIDMYSKCGSMVDARQAFGSIDNPDIVSWNSLLLGYADNGRGEAALDLFSKMKAARGCSPTSVTYVAALKACSSLAATGESSGKEECLKRGREIHLEVGSNLNRHVLNTLIDMYAKCGSMSEARQVFDSIENPDVISWNALMMGYADNGEGLVALDVFSRMKARGCAPTSVTYIAALKACTSLAAVSEGSLKVHCLECGRQIHAEIGSDVNRFVQNTLIDMYAKCGSMAEARRVFDSMEDVDVVSFNVLLLGYAENGDGHEALDLFTKMKARGCPPDSITYMAVLKACTSLAVGSGKTEALERGREIHSEIGGSLGHNVRSTLIDMYSKCGSMADARQVFDTIETPNVVSWTALILGYADNGEERTALDMFSRMKDSGCEPDSVTHVAALKACGLTGDLALGRRIHSEIRDFSAHVVACLVAFYAKCGSMKEAREVFDLYPEARDVSTWSALLTGYASYGDTDSVFKCFEAMQDAGLKPNAVTFICVLLCCNHSGLVEKAREYFEAMPVHYGVVPSVMHYTCMVDALGRVNQLKEALEMMRGMPWSPHAVTWNALLGACRRWKNVEIGRMAFQSLVFLDSKYASAHVLMAQIYGGEQQPRTASSDAELGGETSSEVKKTKLEELMCNNGV